MINSSLQPSAGAKTNAEIAEEAKAAEKERYILLHSGYALREYRIQQDLMLWVNGKDAWESSTPLKIGEPIKFGEYHIAMPLEWLEVNGKRIEI